MADKYSATTGKNPNKMGILLQEQTVAIANNTMDTINKVATEINENNVQLIGGVIYLERMDGTEMTCEHYYQGICYVWNVTDAVEITDHISSISQDNVNTTINFEAGYVASGETIEVGYYAAAVGTVEDDCLLKVPDSDEPMSHFSTQSLSHLNDALKYISPVNLFQLGYKYDECMIVKEFDVGDLAEEPSHTDLLRFGPSSDTSTYHSPIDQDYPMVITSVRVVAPLDGTNFIAFKTFMNSGGLAEFKYDEGDYLPFNVASLLTYIGRRDSAYIYEVRVPTAMRVTDYIGIDAYKDTASAYSGPAVVIISGYYKYLGESV